MKKLFYYNMAILFAIIYHLTQTTFENNNTIKYITISCNNHADIDNFYNKYLSQFLLSKEDQDFLNTYNFFEYINIIKEKKTYRKQSILALIQNKICIGIVIFQYDFKDLGKLAGEYFYKKNNVLLREYNFGFIEFLYIKPDFRKKGYAKLLINQALIFFQSMNYTCANLIVKAKNQAAINLYKQLNFTQLNPQEKMIHIPYQPAIQQILDGYYILLEKQIP